MPSDAAARIVAFLNHVFGKVCRVGVTFARQKKRCRVAVLHPAGARISQLRQVIDRVITAPFSRGIASVQRFGPIKSRVTTRHGAVIEIVDVAAPVRIHHISKQHLLRTQRRFKLSQRPGVSHVIPLAQPTVFLKTGHANRQEFAIAFAQHRSMMGPDHFEALDFETRAGLHPDVFNSLGRQTVPGAITIGQRARRIIERFGVDIFQISSVVGAYPPKVFVMSDVGKRKSEAGVAGKVPSFVTVHVALINLTRAKERKVWIDQKHRVAGFASRRRDDPTIRADVVRKRGIDFSSLQAI